MNFIPNKHELFQVIFIQFPNFRKGKRESERERERGERERGKRDNFCVINVKYKEISWRVRKEEEVRGKK